jgi:hypothetical protein
MKQNPKKRDFIQCEMGELCFGTTTSPTSTNGDVTIKWLKEKEGETLETGAREYQREKVASLDFKQSLLLTILLKGYAKIPQIHIRVSKRGKAFYYELVDGQQRVTSILGFLKGEYNLPSKLVVDGCDVGGFSAEKLRQEYPNLYNKILDYRILCGWYENMDDEMTADLFINVLNKVNTMKQQEIRNAVRGFLSTYIRNTARFEKHNLFTTIQTDGSKPQKSLLHFSKSFSLKGRMEVDEWLSEIIYLYLNGFRKGVQPAQLTDWIKKVQAEAGDYSTQEKFKKLKKEIDELLDFSYKVITSVSSDYKQRLTPMLSQMLILYGYSLKSKYGKLQIDTYTTKFFDVYKKWSDIKTKIWVDYDMPNGTPMKPFNEMFGGKNSNAIGGICKVLDMELAADLDSFGVIELDSRETFSKGDILKKWYEQDCKDYYTGLPLDEDDFAGDHYIPRSYGIKRGGVTEYHNLVVCHHTINSQKLNIHGDDFIKQFRKEELV